MIYTWELKDIHPGVLTVNNNKTEHWLIGYIVGVSDKPTLVSLRDGMTQRFENRDALVEHLNKARMSPVLDYVQVEVWVGLARRGRDRPIRES